MACKTLCQLLMTIAIAFDRLLVPRSRTWLGPAERTFRAVREGGKLLFECLHLCGHSSTKIS